MPHIAFLGFERFLGCVEMTHTFAALIHKLSTVSCAKFRYTGMSRYNNSSGISTSVEYDQDAVTQQSTVQSHYIGITVIPWSSNWYKASQTIARTPTKAHP